MPNRSSEDEVIEGCVGAAFLVALALAVEALMPKPKPFTWPDTLETPNLSKQENQIYEKTPIDWRELALLGGLVLSATLIFAPLLLVVVRFSIQTVCLEGIGVLLGVLVAYNTVSYGVPYYKQKREEARLREMELEERAKIPSPPLVPPIDFSTARMYTVQLPSDTAWQPKQAELFMEQLLHKFGRLTFQIVATEGKLTWRILDLRLGLEPSAIIQSVRAFYPEADISVGQVEAEEKTFNKPFYRYFMAFCQAQDFIGPIRYVEDLIKFDPLTNLTQEMNELRIGERVIYTLFVAEHAQFVYDQSKVLLTKHISKKPSSHSMSQASYQLVFGEEGEPLTYGFAEQEVFKEKINSSVFLCLLFIQIDAPTYERIEDLAHLDSHIFQFKNPPYNALLRFEHPFGDSIVFVDTPEMARRTNTTEQLNKWLINESRLWQNFRLILNPRELASLWHFPHEGFTSSNIQWVRGKQIPMSADMRGETNGILLGYNAHAGVRRPVYLLPKDRQAHMIIIGKTRMGKSTLLHNLIHQDIQAGYGVAVIDPTPHDSSLIRQVLRWSIPSEREKDVVVWDLANRDNPPPLNLVHAPSGILSSDAAALIMAIFEKVYGAEFAEARMGHTLSMAVQAVMADETPTVRDISKLFRDSVYRGRLIDLVHSRAAEEFWDDFENMKAKEQQEYARPILHRIERFYDHDLLYPVLCHPYSLDLRSLIQQKKIILISISGPHNARLTPYDQVLLGSIFVSQFQLAIASEAPVEPYYLYIDEAQHFVTTALDEIFNEASKRNLSLTLANQFLEQLAGKTLKAVMGNVGAMVSFQVGDDDAHTLSSYLKPQFTIPDLLHLQLYNAAVLMRHSGKQQPPFSLETLPSVSYPSDPSDAELREKRIRDLSVQQYTPMSSESVLQWLNDRYPRRRRPLDEASKQDNDYGELLDN